MVEGTSHRRKAGLLAGPVFFAVILVLPVPDGMSAAAWQTVAVALLMATWWITEAIPIPATALLPVVLLPLLGVTNVQEATTPYANHLIFLFLGGFMIAAAMQRWQLHERIALTIIHWLGTRPKNIIWGFAIASAFLSMWVSNTATALMMLPIAISVIHLVEKQTLHEGPFNNFNIALLLIIAYGCNVGGLGTLIGTPPNALLASFFSESYDYEISFFRWMLVGLPLVMVGLPVVYFVITKMIYPVEAKSIPGGKEMIDQRLQALGPMSRAEWAVSIVFVLVAVSWIIRPYVLTAFIPNISDAGIAIAGALALFLIPISFHQQQFALDWKVADQLPWGVLILFGGGLSLASAFQSSGLAEWIGHSAEGFQGLSLLLIIPELILVVIFLTEVTSNTATAAALLPVLASAAAGMGHAPMLFAFPAVIGASCAFMLPVATPPNAVVYGSGKVTIPQMAKAGIWLNMVFVVIISVASFTLLKWVFELQV